MHSENFNLILSISYRMCKLAFYGAAGNDLRLEHWDKKMEFDPVRHHRHFCPWIASADGASMCGWKQTLSALDHERESSHDPPLDSPSTSSIFKVGWHLVCGCGKSI